MNLIIVESPTKARTLSMFLENKKYKIESSYGHIRDLPKSKIGIDVENDFTPHYIIPLKARKNVTRLRKESAKAEKVILATDEDREGEAIAWHLVHALDLAPSKIAESKIQRIVFHEVTKTAIEEALKKPRKLDLNLVDAQQARRILDRLVGYLLSPFLWKKIARGLSAGRVQSVALRLIAERDEEIKNFNPREYWTISAILKKLENAQELEAMLQKINGETVPKLGIKTQKEAQKITKALEKCRFKIATVEKKEIKKNPPSPFTTSTLQQEASKKLRLPARMTMRFAQSLYENGFITYMRTDSLNLSQESLNAVHRWIEKNLSKDYKLATPRIFKTKSKLAQEAHEAIRPTDPFRTPETLKSEHAGENKIYELIWRRFVASQLPQAVFDSTSVDIEARQEKNGDNYFFRANGNILKFDGFLKFWPQKFEEKELPELKTDEILKLKEIIPAQHFTEPPPRYNEASLIKALEEYGIGRPSTYAPIISVIQARNYVQKNADRRFQPTEIGMLVNKVLTEHFETVVDIKFTAHMEDDLDEIARGEKKWQEVVKEFYEPFSKNLEQKYGEVSKEKLAPEEKTDQVCEKCAKSMVIKTGRFGRFLACSGFPECKNAKSLNDKGGGIGQNFGKCPKCVDGEIKMRKTKRGRFFYGCSRYPECDYATWTRPKAE